MCFLLNLLWKIPKFHLISWCGNFVEKHRFGIVSGESPETMRKLWLSRKCPHYETKWNYGIFRNECKWPEAALHSCPSDKV